MRNNAILFLSMLIFIGGCAGGKSKNSEELPVAALREELPEASGGFVLSINGETLTAAEVVAPLAERLQQLAQSNNFEQFELQLRSELEKVIVRKVADILLYQQAKKSAPDNIDDVLERAIESEIRKFITGFEGNYARAEDALKEMGMDWVSFREYQKRMILVQSYIANKLPEQKPITYSELMEYYNANKEKLFATSEMITVRLIDIMPAKLEITDPNENRQQTAAKLADNLVERLRAGEDFAQLAGETRDTKYNFSVERLVPLIDTFCTFPVIEKVVVAEPAAVPAAVCVNTTFLNKDRLPLILSAISIPTVILAILNSLF